MSALASLFSNTALVSAITVLSRILGFVRDLLVAKALGAGGVADAFFVAFRIPNLLRSFVAEGAMSSAVVPVMAEEHTRGAEHAQSLFRSVATILLLTTVALTALGFLFAEELVSAIAPGFRGSSEKFHLTISLTQLMLPYIIAVSLIALMSGALTTYRIFGVGAWSQVFMNVVLITGGLVALLFSPEEAAIVLGISVVIGGVVQVVIQLPTLRRLNLSLWPHRLTVSQPLRTIGRLLVPALVGATVYQLAVFASTLLASLLEDGAISWLFYADRITQLPLGVFTVALGSVLLPSLSSARAAGRESEFSSLLQASLRSLSFIIVPIAGYLFFFAEELVPLLFERGAFTARDSAATAQVVTIISLGLWGASAQGLLARSFIAEKNTLTPTLNGIVVLFVSVLTSAWAMGPVAQGSNVVGDGVNWLQIQLSTLGAPSPQLGAAGVALGTVIGPLVGFLLLASYRRFSLVVTTLPFLLLSIGVTSIAGILSSHITTPGFFGFITGSTVYGIVALLLLALAAPQERKKIITKITR